jgi:predicted Abi (CAAX) family protease
VLAGLYDYFKVKYKPVNRPHPKKFPWTTNAMTHPMTVDQLAHWIRGAFALNQGVFQEVVRSPTGQTAALLVVLTAGLSLAIGQSIILFINRVSPFRFVFSLLLNAVLFTCGFLFLVLSTWVLGWFPGFVLVPWTALVTVWGLSYAPLLFSFLGALPYAGVPILNGLSVWRLLSMIVGFSAIAQVSGAVAFAHAAVGWSILQLLEGTIGQPIAKLGQRLAERVAGVDLADNATELAAMIESGLEQISTVLTGDTSPESAAVDSGQKLSFQSAIAENVTSTEIGRTVTINPLSSRRPSEQLRARLSYDWQGIPQAIRLGSILLGMGLLFAILALLLYPIRNSLFYWHETLPQWLQWGFDLVWIGVIAIVFAGLLAPLEALGWWAGWYGDRMDASHGRTGAMPRAGDRSERRSISRYVIYLDGVAQSGEEYTPDVAEFIRSLQAVLPTDVEFVQGLMMYSVFNRPLSEDRPLAWLWRLADRVRWKNPAALLGIFLNLRNILIVGVSADRRYGPIYNQGIAQVLYNGLIQRGYEPGSGIPITLIGYSGGGEMSVAAAPYLKRVLGAEIEVISLGGVMSANNNFLKLEHLYHLVGARDRVSRLSSILFPGRTRLFPLSYWNRALRKGKISQISLGPMGHQVPGGIMDPNAFLPNGESYLQHTIANVLSILEGQFLIAAPSHPRPVSNYEYYQQADFNHYRYYPLDQTVNAKLYHPIAAWTGRLILPQHKERRQVRGVWFEVHHAEVGYESWAGQIVMLRWIDEPDVKQRVRAVTRDVHFSVDAEYSSQYGGSIHPDRLDHWQQVGPLESLAGAHPQDDLIVMLTGRVQIEIGDSPILRIGQQPVEITGRYYGLVQFIAPIEGTDRFQVRHFDSTSRQFSGEITLVSLPQVLPAPAYGSYASTTRALERSPLNEMGWYIYGAPDRTGMFIVQSLAPRSLLRLQPDRVIFGDEAAYRYIRREAWENVTAQKGRISSVLCAGDRQDEEIQAAIDEWQEGDRALVLHVYGGIGGKRKEPAAATPLFFGHFAYGVATVIRDPLSHDLRFEIQYHQVYSHNTDGLTAGTHHWSRYMGDRQWGWLGNRPVCDILVKFDPFTGDYAINQQRQSPLTNMLNQLQAMTARYRIGDGTGATYVGAANNCAQDSNQALFASIRSIEQAMATLQPVVQSWQTTDPVQAQRYQQLLALKVKLRRQLQPLGAPRADWEANEFNLGTTLEDDPLRNLWTGIGSWRTLLPRKASDAIVHVFLKQGAAVWVLRTTQVGGYDEDIEPIAPMTL